MDATLPDEEKIPLCKDADALLVASLNVSLELIQSCPNVKIIQLVSAGYDHIDLKAVGEMGIPVANNGGANAIAVAEHTLGLMLSLTQEDQSAVAQCLDRAQVAGWVKRSRFWRDHI